MSATDSTAAIAAVARIEFAGLVAGLTRYCGDVGLAEELAQEALTDAVKQWPLEGMPRQPGAWLLAVAKRKAVDTFRRQQSLRRKYAQIGAVARATEDGVDEADLDDHIEGDQLRLMFVACHPTLPVASRVALTLRLLGGLTTTEIARAYLLSASAVAQRIVRAKKAITEAGVPFEVPVGDDRAARLGSVLEVIYLIYNEGYSATAGDDWLRPDLCREALRLGRVLAALAADEPEVHGLLALMEIQSSRLTARVGPSGEPVLLLDQDRRRWDPLHIRRGLQALERAEAGSAGRPGPYTLQAAIAACHARALRPEDTDWARVARLYDVLAGVAPSPIVELNRAVAVSMAEGPVAGMELLDQLEATGLLDRYHLFHSVRGDLLAKLGRHDEAGAAFERGAALAANAVEQRLLQGRARASRQS